MGFILGGGRTTAKLMVCVAGAALLVVGPGRSASAADSVTLKNGMTYIGSFSPIGSISGDPLSGVGATDLKQIVICDDKLRRTFFATKQLATKFGPAVGPVQVRFLIKQRESQAGRGVGSVGTILGTTPFDEHGRRIFSMSTSDGRADIVQGITEITPTYARVTALQGSGSYVWQMAIATSSIPRETLSKILRNHTDPKNPDDRLKIVRLYIQSERIQDARTELDGVIKDFPGLAALPGVAKELTQMAAQRLIKEIELRRDAGQPLLAIAMLEKFPSEGVAGETLLKVREMLDEFKAIQTQGEQISASLGENLGLIKDERLQQDLAAIVKEMQTELNVHNLDRLVDYQRLSTDDTLKPENKLSLAISGWLLGSGSGVDSLPVSKSLVEVRDLVRRYLQSARKLERDAVLGQLTSLEGATPAYIAKIIAHMRPPQQPQPVAVEEDLPAAQQASDPAGEGEAASAEENPPQIEQRLAGATQVPGLFELTVPGLAEHPEIKYWVQLPPEYSPYRRYPCIVTLNGGGTSPQQQIDWWAGDYKADAKSRFGQASRHGYILISPQWLREHQRQYDYSAREHAATLYPLRDACKRFSIDTDRVYLSGHSLGGDAAWDIGLAHPDLWAGVIPIVATADKHVGRYWENGRNVSFYFVSGEKDGDKLAKNATDWNRYLQKTGYDTTIVQYQGRGHEHFHDEIQNLFQWMNLHKRNFFPREIDVVSMRPWDSFFWWVDVAKIPDHLTILPSEWPKEGVRPAPIEARVLETNAVTLSTPAKKATVWLSPDIVNFDSKVTVTINNRRQLNITPSIGVLLEDARARADRQHPFWAKAESP